MFAPNLAIGPISAGAGFAGISNFAQTGIVLQVNAQPR